MEVVTRFFANSDDELTQSIKTLIKRPSKFRRRVRKHLKVKPTEVTHISYFIHQVAFQLFSQAMTPDSLIELFYFCDKLVDKCRKNCFEGYIPKIIESFIDFLSFYLHMWLHNNNIWKKMIQLASESFRNKPNYGLALIVHLLF